MSKQGKQTGKVNYVWVLAGGYLVYLAAQLLLSAATGKSDTPLVGLVSGVAFLVVDVLLLRREWKAYRFGLAHKDDPDTWSEETEGGDGSDQ